MPISDYYKGLREKIGSELLLIPSVAAIIRNSNDEILFQHPRDSQYWSLPAGAIEPGETAAQAIVREVWEETGLFVNPTKILSVLGGEEFRFIYPNGDHVEYTILVFNCEIVSGGLESMDGESVELRFFSEENKPKLALPYPDFMFQKLFFKDTYFQPLNYDE
ncbi:NUDIX domain-containing protein [Aquibacillus koreensis]|uniref:NUDIX domain-containing protein n=1 Tax=Aquibacillus koreensis TaxID=279446 RepID=A0A9X3WRB3_9BACI|nr:NUDIX domain-containing protein [Aquibacillus koreensis]MCT2536889.1 NUDIX domain-containing protein [Aquibacillus koreensis]MDC3421979.1 NUDIX domain-containing protein [Aquibacillus koreensis]